MGRKKQASKLAAAAGAAKVQASDLQDRIGPAVSEARDRIGPMVEDARDRIGPAVSDARDRIGPMVEEAKERLTPVVEDARERLADLAGNVATRLDDALPDDRTPQVVKDASANKKGGKLKKALLLAGLAGAAAVVAQKLRGSNEPQWQSSVPASRPASPTAPSAADQAAKEAAAPNADDAAGGSPDEAAADAQDEPRMPTTPDSPAETVEVKKN